MAFRISVKKQALFLVSVSGTQNFETRVADGSKDADTGSSIRPSAIGQPQHRRWAGDGGTCSVIQVFCSLPEYSVDHLRSGDRDPPAERYVHEQDAVGVPGRQADE